MYFYPIRTLHDSNEWTFTSEQHNQLVSMLVYLESEGGSAIIEYYENDDEIPAFAKTINW